MLTVCTGSVCRSPLAAAELDHGPNRVSPGGLEVTGAGVYALVDEGFEERVAQLARDRGLDPAAHRARQASPDLLRNTDLVLVMAGEHTRPVLEAAPRLLKKVFPLREFARIVQHVFADPALDRAVPADRLDPWSWLVQQAPRVRQRVPVRQVERSDAIDPYRQENAVPRQSAAGIFAATDAIVEWKRRYAQRDNAG